MTVDTNEVLATSFASPRFEIVPMKGVDEQLDHLPVGATVTVTASPSKGIEATLVLAERLLGRGCTVVPHLAARLVSGRSHLVDIIRRIEDMGIRDIFVIAGDAEQPAGPYEGAASLLRTMAEMDHHIDRIGVTGYPESHAFISDHTTIQVMYEKSPFATYIVSQICYDADTIAGWVAAVRQRGVHLPIYIGLPGVVDRARLLRISMKVGLGDSVRFLRKQSGLARKLMGGYTPDDLVEALQSLLHDESANVAGWHLFTFNEVEKTEQWRQQMLARFQGAS